MRILTKQTEDPMIASQRQSITHHRISHGLLSRQQRPTLTQPTCLLACYCSCCPPWRHNFAYPISKLNNLNNHEVFLHSPCRPFRSGSRCFLWIILHWIQCERRCFQPKHHEHGIHSFVSKLGYLIFNWMFEAIGNLFLTPYLPFPPFRCMIIAHSIIIQ